MSNNGKKAGRYEGRIVLAADTSTSRCDLVIAAEGAVLSLVSGDAGVPHSRTFFDNLNLALGLAGVDVDRIDIFAAVTGPGSFTGLRVGLAAIGGLADTCRKPAIGIDRFDLTALTAGVAGRILVLLDAGRSEIFAGLRNVDTEANVIASGTDTVGPPSVILPEILRAGAPDMIIGSGLRSSREVLTDLLSSIPHREIDRPDPRFDGLQLVSAPFGSVSAELLAGHALRLDRAGAAPPLKAAYIRPSDAEIKIRPVAT